MATNHLKTSPLESETHLDIWSRESQIALCKNIQPFVSALIEKVSDCHDSHSVLNLPKGDSSITFSRQECATLFFRCWARLILAFPERLLLEIDSDTSRTLDFLIQNWRFLVNNEEISTQLWCDNPHLDTGVVLKWVPSIVSSVLQKNEDDALKWKWIQFVDTLLPPRQAELSSREITSQWVKKLHQIHMTRTITITIVERTVNWN